MPRHICTSDIPRRAGADGCQLEIRLMSICFILKGETLVAVVNKTGPNKCRKSDTLISPLNVLLEAA